jgi:signal transduction histidine kinase
MRFKTWPVAALGLLALLAVIAGSLLEASRQAQDIFVELDELNTHHRLLEARLRRLRSDVHLSGIFVRDYLLDHDRDRLLEYRARLTELREATLSSVEALRALTAEARVSDGGQVEGLQGRLEAYWQAFDPLFTWTPIEKITQSARFLRREVLPRRNAVLAIAQEIEEVNNANLAVQRAEVQSRQDAFRSDITALTRQSLALGLVVAAIAVFRLRYVERKTAEHQAQAAEHQAQAEEAEQEMRRLSQQLVATQEEERKNLSRELHDHVGQMVTALRMELGRIDRLRVPTNTRLAEAVAESQALVDEMMRTVRDIAWALRPSMLDDIGIQPALEWLVAGFRRRYDIEVDLVIAGPLDQLDEQRRTCAYRVVQEALTNCARHAGASQVQIRVTGGASAVHLEIADDGRGFGSGGVQMGLGLRGIRERIRELGGTLKLGRPGEGGAQLHVQLPMAAGSDVACAS